MTDKKDLLLDIQDLTVRYHTDSGLVHAVEETEPSACTGGIAGLRGGDRGGQDHHGSVGDAADTDPSRGDRIGENPL